MIVAGTDTGVLVVVIAGVVAVAAAVGAVVAVAVVGAVVAEEVTIVAAPVVEA